MLRAVETNQMAPTDFASLHLHASAHQRPSAPTSLQHPPSAKPISCPSSTCLFDVNSLTHAAHFYLFQFIQAPFTSCQVYSPPVQHHRFFLDAAETVSVETDSRHRALAFLPTANHLQSPIRRQSGAQMMNNPKVPSNL